MVEQVVRLTVSLKPNEGQMDEFKSIAATMTETTKGEPDTLGYEWFMSGDGTRFRLVETYVNASALEAHFMGPVIQQLVPKMTAACSVEGLEIYGDPGPKVAEMVAGLGAVVYQYWMGINR